MLPVGLGVLGPFPDLGQALPADLAGEQQLEELLAEAAVLDDLEGLDEHVEAGVQGQRWLLSDLAQRLQDAGQVGVVQQRILEHQV